MRTHWIFLCVAALTVACASSRPNRAEMSGTRLVDRLRSAESHTLPVHISGADPDTAAFEAAPRYVLEAIRTWRFKPAERMGEPVAVDFVIQVRIAPREQPDE